MQHCEVERCRIRTGSCRRFHANNHSHWKQPLCWQDNTTAKLSEYLFCTSGSVDIYWNNWSRLGNREIRLPVRFSAMSAASAWSVAYHLRGYSNLCNDRQRGTVAVGCGLPMCAMLRAQPGLWRTSLPGCIALNEAETGGLLPTETSFNSCGFPA